MTGEKPPELETLIELHGLCVDYQRAYSHIAFNKRLKLTVKDYHDIFQPIDDLELFTNILLMIDTKVDTQ